MYIYRNTVDNSRSADTTMYNYVTIVNLQHKKQVSRCRDGVY